MALKMQMNHSHAFQKGQKCRLYKKCDHFLGSKVEFICQTNPSPPSRARILMSSLFFVGIEFKVFSKINIAGHGHSQYTIKDLKYLLYEQYEKINTLQKLFVYVHKNT